MSLMCAHSTMTRWIPLIVTQNVPKKHMHRGGGCIPPPPPPHFFGWGMACTNIPPPPPLLEDKITLNLAFIVKKLIFLTVKLLKTQKIARSLRSLAHMYSETRSLRFCRKMYSFFNIIYVKKGVE